MGTHTKMFSQLAGVPTWGDDEDNRQPGQIGTVEYDLKSPPRNLRTISTSPFGANKADDRYYGNSRYNGSYPGVRTCTEHLLHVCTVTTSCTLPMQFGANKTRR